MRIHFFLLVGNSLDFFSRVGSSPPGSATLHSNQRLFHKDRQTIHKSVRARAYLEVRCGGGGMNIHKKCKRNHVFPIFSISHLFFPLFSDIIFKFCLERPCVHGPCGTPWYNPGSHGNQEGMYEWIPEIQERLELGPHWDPLEFDPNSCDLIIFRGPL